MLSPRNKTLLPAISFSLRLVKLDAGRCWPSLRAPRFTALAPAILSDEREQIGCCKTSGTLDDVPPCPLLVLLEGWQELYGRRIIRTVLLSLLAKMVYGVGLDVRRTSQRWIGPARRPIACELTVDAVAFLETTVHHRITPLFDAHWHLPPPPFGSSS